MKIGDVIINPYVKQEFKGKPNPMYKSMVLSIGTKLTKALRYDGKIIDYYTRDCKDFEVSHHIDISTQILNEQLKEQK